MTMKGKAKTKKIWTDEKRWCGRQKYEMGRDETINTRQENMAESLEKENERL